MLANRMKEIRKARGLSLAELSVLMDGAVTKQALSKYENGQSEPRPSTLVLLARALGVKSIDLLSEPDYSFQVLSYRTRAPLRSKARGRIEASLRRSLEERVGLEDQIDPSGLADIGERVRVCTLDDVERVAADVRANWGIGLEPIWNLTEILEARSVHVFELPGIDEFDGLVAIARTSDQSVRAVGIAENPDTGGDRQRFNLAHELGHVLIDCGELDEEVCANRFAGAFLLPPTIVFRDCGRKRDGVTYEELLLLKRSWGVSAQCILHRLRDLDVINQSAYEEAWREINALGYRLREPLALPRETSSWLERGVVRGAAEGLISREQAAAYLGVPTTDTTTDGLNRHALLGLSRDERNSLLRDQAHALADYYESVASDEWLGADLDPKE